MQSCLGKNAVAAYTYAFITIEQFQMLFKLDDKINISFYSMMQLLFKYWQPSISALLRSVAKRSGMRNRLSAQRTKS